MASTTSKPSTSEKPLSFMEKIGPQASVYRPSAASGPGHADGQPRLIVIGSWTGARDIHIAKYIDKYREMFPSAQVLLLKSSTANIARPSTIGPAIKAAVPVVRAAIPDTSSPSGPPELLIHVFSNGGSSSSVNLYEQFAAAAGSGETKHLPRHVIIFDSCPGVLDIQHIVDFFTVGVSPLQKLLFAPILYTAATVWNVLMALGLAPNSLDRWRKAQNNKDPATEVRRTYIYSASDVLVKYRDVEDHAAEAKKKGFSVTLEKFEDSAHVAHMRQDEGRYWDIVRKTWNGGL